MRNRHPKNTKDLLDHAETSRDSASQQRVDFFQLFLTERAPIEYTYNLESSRNGINELFARRYTDGYIRTDEIINFSSLTAMFHLLGPASSSSPALGPSNPAESKVIESFERSSFQDRSSHDIYRQTANRVTALSAKEKIKHIYQHTCCRLFLSEFIHQYYLNRLFQLPISMKKKSEVLQKLLSAITQQMNQRTPAIIIEEPNLQFMLEYLEILTPRRLDSPFLASSKQELCCFTQCYLEHTVKNLLPIFDVYQYLIQLKSEVSDPQHNTISLTGDLPENLKSLRSHLKKMPGLKAIKVAHQINLNPARDSLFIYESTSIKEENIQTFILTPHDLPLLAGILNQVERTLRETDSFSLVRTQKASDLYQSLRESLQKMQQDHPEQFEALHQYGREAQAGRAEQAEDRGFLSTVFGR